MNENEEAVWINLLFRGERILEEDQKVQKDDYVDEFKSRDMIAETIPILEFKFKNLQELASLLGAKASRNNESEMGIINGLVITSPRVVEALRRAEELFHGANMSGYSIFNVFNPDYVFVVGEKSAQECELKLGLKCNKTSSQSGSSRSLAEYIKKFCNHEQARINLLYPKSSLADNSIENTLVIEDRIQIEAIVAYETVVVDDLANIVAEKMQILKIPDGGSKLIINMIFFSPSGVDGFFKIDQNLFLTELKVLFPNRYTEFRYSSIGKTTEAALLRNDKNVLCVSENPNPKSLVECILREYVAQ